MDYVCRWDEQKNAKLFHERGISFEEIELRLEEGLFKVIEHPNPSKYPNQKLFVVRLHDYIYLVPFVQRGKEVFLKTIIPSRKWNKLYLEDEL